MSAFSPDEVAYLTDERRVAVPRLKVFGMSI
jgi:hypothetical protein